MKKAVILLSGGLDSTTVMAIAKAEDYAIYGLSFAYGQRHNLELEKAKNLAKNCNIAEHKVINIDIAAFGGSALTDNISVPKGCKAEKIGNEIPVTYVPARNMIFLSMSLAYAETIGSYDIFIGVNVLDYSGYPDCRPEFISSFQNTANLATAASVKGDEKFTIHTPLINFTKAEIIQKGVELGVDYSMTLSCYDPINGVSCGRCDSCQLRLKGFREIGLQDPVVYA